MSKIQKTTEGEASFRLKEDFENEDKAIKGEEPLESDVVIDELKIVNIKYKLKEVLKDDSAWSKNFTFRKKT